MIYVASALSHLTDEERDQVKPWCDAIGAAVVEASMDDTPAWEIRAWIPFMWSGPWREDGRSGGEIYRQNLSFVRDAAALIILGFKGGSLGAGQELAWACSLRIPILHLRYGGEALSRQVEGTPADITFAEFTTAPDIRRTVLDFLRARRHAIEDHPRRLRDRRDVLASFGEAVGNAWFGLTETDRRRVAANARLHPDRAAGLAADPLSLATGSLNELLALTGALAIDPWPRLSGEVPDLDPRQTAALRVAAHEYEWNGDETIDLYVRARMEMALPGVRRLPLLTPDDWMRFRESTRGA